MSKMQLRESDRRTICSTEDVPLLKFYENLFECVFVSLNPFLRIKTVSLYTPKTFLEGDVRYKNEKRRIVDNTEKVKWSELMLLSGLDDIKQIDIALRTSILGLKANMEYQKYQNTLDNALESNKIIQPNEGFIEEIQQDAILKAIAKLGYDNICLGTAGNDSVEIKDILELTNSDESIDEKNLYTKDKKVLVTVHWDSHQTYICSTKENVAKIVHDADLEGFYCDENTKIYWSIQ